MTISTKYNIGDQVSIAKISASLLGLKSNEGIIDSIDANIMIMKKRSVIFTKFNNAYNVKIDDQIRTFYENELTI